MAWGVSLSESNQASWSRFPRILNSGLAKKVQSASGTKVPLSPSSSSFFFSFSLIDINNQITSSLLKSQLNDSATKLAITQLSVRPHVICRC